MKRWVLKRCYGKDKLNQRTSRDFPEHKMCWGSKNNMPISRCLCCQNWGKECGFTFSNHVLWIPGYIMSHDKKSVVLWDIQIWYKSRLEFQTRNIFWSCQAQCCRHWGCRFDLRGFCGRARLMVNANQNAWVRGTLEFEAEFYSPFITVIYTIVSRDSWNYAKILVFKDKSFTVRLLLAWEWDFPEIHVA